MCVTSILVSRAGFLTTSSKQGARFGNLTYGPRHQIAAAYNFVASQRKPSEDASVKSCLYIYI